MWLTLVASALLSITFLNQVFYAPFERVAGGIFQIVNIVPSLIRQLNTNWLAVSLQHACCCHYNVKLNEKKYNLGAGTYVLN